MFSKASGDAPQTEIRGIVQKRDDIYNWRMSYEAWQTFNDLRKKGLFYDVALVADSGEKFQAHRIVLCTCGHYFRSLFSGRWKSSEQQEIKIAGVKASALERVIHFAYTRKTILHSAADAKELLIASGHFGIEEIMKACANYLADGMKATNCLDLWLFSKTYYCKQLETRVFSFILDNFQTISGMPDSVGEKGVHHLDGKDLVRILESDELNVKNEKLPLRVILKWAEQATSSQRGRYIFPLMSSVRLGLLSADFLSSFMKNHSIISASKDARSLLDHHIVLSTMNESLADEKGALSELSLKLTDGFLRCNDRINENFDHDICDVLRRTSRPRYPRELLLVVGGWSGNAPTSSSEAFDPGTKKWSHMNVAFPSLLMKPRAYHGVSYMGGYVFVVGGFDGQLTYNSCDRYSLLTKKWKKMCGMHHRRCYVGVSHLDGLIYAVGGSDGGGDPLRLKSAERFDPNVNVWTRLPDMTERRSDAGVCGMDGRLYVAGGFTGHQCVFSVEYFDVETQQWCRVTPMRIPRSGVTVIAYKNRVLALGGFDGNSSRLNSVEAFVPELNLWTTLPNMLTGRSNFGACVIRGRLIVMGGFNGSSTCNNVEYFDDEGDVELLDNTVPRSSREPSSSVGRNGISPTYEGNGSGDNEEDNLDIMQNSRGLSRQTRNDLSTNREIPTGVWKRLPEMKVTRSALSCCVLKGLPPKFLRSVISPSEFTSHTVDSASSSAWSDIDRLLALCIKNSSDNNEFFKYCALS